MRTPRSIPASSVTESVQYRKLNKGDTLLAG
uniref:Uncharacterized protein n=1 Tax=Arundo donax TaxID=35708 RepID=A0A0A9FD38_ARUDO